MENRDAIVEAAVKSAVRTVGQQVGREITRKVLSDILGGRRRDSTPQEGGLVDLMSSPTPPEDPKQLGSQFSKELEIARFNPPVVQQPDLPVRSGKTVECYECNNWVAIEETKPRVVKEETGSSSGSWSFGGSRRNSGWTSGGVLKNGKRKGSGTNVRYNTGKTYYKNVKVRVCDSCIASEAEAAKNNAVTEADVWKWIIKIVVAITLFFMFGPWALVIIFFLLFL